MTRVTTVSQVDYDKAMIKVTLPERGVESDWISVPSLEYDIPDVNDQVEVTFEEDNFRGGLSHGPFFSTSNPPKVTGPDTYYKTMKKDVVVKYNRATKTLEITADEIIVHGNVTINGNLTINNGDVVADGISLKNHTHECPHGGDTSPPK